MAAVKPETKQNIKLAQKLYKEGNSIVQVAKKMKVSEGSARYYIYGGKHTPGTKSNKKTTGTPLKNAVTEVAGNYQSTTLTLVSEIFASTRLDEQQKYELLRSIFGGANA